MSFESNRRVWTSLAETDPLWAILSEPDKRGSRWEIDAFFKSGRDTIGQEIDEILAAYPGFAFSRALDFGCGVGRLTQALGERFDFVTGVDVAPRMIELADSYNREPDRISFLLNQRPDLSAFESDSFDFVLSLITLQHIDEASILAYLREFLRVLRPGGAAYFQLPTRRRVRIGGLMSLARRVGKRLASQPRYEMNCVARDVVEALIRDCGGEVLRVRENDAGGEKYESFDYLLRKI